jgi:bile acid-coenzyme A ligase
MIMMPNGIAFFETCFALWKLGAIPLPVSPNTTDAELTAYVDLVRPRALIGARVGGNGPVEIPATLAIDPSLSTDALPAKVSKHWRASMSGGSTGRPKVIVDHTPGLFDPLGPVLEQTVDGVHLNPGPLYHSGPFGLSLRGLFVGSRVINMDRFDPIETLRLIDTHRVEWLYMVPTMMHRIWRLPAEERDAFDVSSLRTVFHMASSCPTWLKQAWIDWIGPEKIWELYSSAENPGRTVINGVEWLTHPGSVGKVQPGSELAVLDEEGMAVPQGEIGEVFFKTDAGPDAAFHYLGAEKKMFGEWQSMGDLGYLDPEGYLYIVDRRTDLIVSGGVNVYPAEIEAALDAHPQVASSVVIGLPDADLGHRAHAIVQPADGAALDDNALRAFLRDRLVRYKIPRSFEYVDRPLRDNTGKVRRSALRDERIAAATPEIVALTR